MDKLPPLKEKIELVADHMRLLAALLAKRPDLQESEKEIFAQIMRDLADRLDQLNEGDAQCPCPSGSGREDRP